MNISINLVALLAKIIYIYSFFIIKDILKIFTSFL